VAAVPAAVLVPVAGVLGLGVGVLLRLAAARFPWTGGERSQAPREDAGAGAAMSLPQSRHRGGVVVVLGAAVLFAATAWRFGWSWELPAFLCVAAAAVLLADVDLRHRLLPDRVVAPTGLAVAVLLTGAAAVDDRWDDLRRALLAGAVALAVGLVMALLAPAGLGMGDVKLAAVLGLALGWLGWRAVLVGFFLGFVLQAVVAGGLLLARRASRGTELPFGPALLVGALLTVVLTGTA
jgi:leader peptidase (prepilin peptidase) / N-methyltransferase